jgi:tetratricopeptide (TPR) repeat protein
MNDCNFLRWPRTVVGATILLLAAVPAQAQGSGCGPLENHYGPFDYRTQRDRLLIVEKFHFTPGVEALSRGNTNMHLAADISYLMRTSPNHHRGLVALMRLAEREKSPQPQHLQYSVDCYFERAIRFRKDDTIVRILFAQYLHKQKRTPDALRELSTASRLAADNGFTHYNIGLVYFELGEFDLALEQAHKARALGFDQPELAEMLKGKNRWKDAAN